ncbi:MAG: SusD/RagB family nutrient-binding outer membrane lipoprotein [Bacteroidota bacterium]
MKYISKLWVLLLFVGLTACDNTEFDLLDNPNAPTPETASFDALYNNIQLTFENIYSTSQGSPGAQARMYHMGSFTYLANVTPNTFNFLWNVAYAGLFPDIDALVTIANERGLAIHSGTSKIMKAYTLMALVDLMGNVPNSQAMQGLDLISPPADDGSTIYANAVALLDEAIAELTGTTANSPAIEQFYGGDAAKWITFAKTLKLRAAVTTRLVDPAGSAATINALVSEGDIIDDASEDFQYQFGNQRTNPNSRHPFYNSHYEVGDGPYLSNYYMWLLRADKEDENENAVIDPRIRFYFYRKISDAAAQDPTTYSCHFSLLPDQAAQPDHWAAVDPRLPYCIVLPGDGYSGRDHGNGEGIPPDGPTRTSYGLYPGGGMLDIDEFEDTRNEGTTGGLGEGIWPIMLSSFVDFMRAEAALTINTNDDPRSLLATGIRKSMDKVISFKNLVPLTLAKTLIVRGDTINVEDNFVPSDADVSDYINFVLSQYDAATSDDERLDIVMKEYFIALWGNGLEAYNMYRRTGKPGNMQPALETFVGDFPRSFLLPNDHVTRNSAASQRTLSDLVFWDNGTSSVQ